jgi:hypothetical protein
MDALKAGHFRDFNPSEERFEPSDLHVALTLVASDIERARATLDVDGDWRLKLMGVAARANETSGAVMAAASDILWAQVYYDRAEDLFQSQRAAARFLLGRAESPLPDPSQRSPRTPLSDAVDGIWREEVDTSDIGRLIDSDIWPLGSRIPADLYNDDQRAEIEREMIEQMLPELQALAEQLDPERAASIDFAEIAKQSSGEVLARMTAAAGEGLENRGRP